jgi:hypothetical protein
MQKRHGSSVGSDGISQVQHDTRYTEMKLEMKRSGGARPQMVEERQILYGENQTLICASDGMYRSSSQKVVNPHRKKQVHQSKSHM